MSTHDIGMCPGDEHGKLCAVCRQEVIDGILTGTRDERGRPRPLQATDSYAPLHAQAPDKLTVADLDLYPGY